MKKIVSVAILILLVTQCISSLTISVKAESQVTIMPTRLPQGIQVAASVWDGTNAYIFGGTSRTAGPFNSILKYNPSTGFISSMSAVLPDPVCDFPAVWTGQYAYIFGGYMAQGVTSDKISRYDPLTDTITLMGARLPGYPPFAIYSMSAIWDGHYAYLFGDDRMSDSILKYDPVNDQITVMSARLPTGTKWMPAVWSGIYAYVFGGRTPYGASDQIVRYDPTHDSTTVMSAKLPIGILVSSAVWAGSCAYVFGGSDINNQMYDSILKYDPTSDSITTVDNLPTPRRFTCAVWNGNSAYIFGGEDSNSHDLDEIVEFSPTTNAGPAGYWKFDEGSGDIAYDSAGTNNGIIRGVPVWTTGVVGGALRFDGAQNNYAAFSSQLDVTDAMTVEVWVYPEFDPTNPAAYPEEFSCAGRQIIRKSSCGDDTFFMAFYSGYYFNPANPVPYISTGFFYQGGGGAGLEPVSIPGLISEGQWYHLVATYKRNDYARLYVNGVEKMAVPTEDKPLRVSSRHLTIGQEADVVGGDPLDTPSTPQTWIGKIDEAKIYNCARTADEIQKDFHAYSGPVGYWKFDEGSGTIAHDSSGNGNDGVIHTATWTYGIVGKALHFNGVDSWVEVPNSPTLTGLSQITVEAWIREDSITAQLKGIVSKCDGWAPPTNAEYFLGTNENGKVFFETDHGTAIFSAQTTPLITEAGRWYHVAGTWSGDAYTIYVDGTPVLSGTCTPQTTLSNTLPVQIGRHGTWSWVYFQGIIDEVKIYNYARTAEEILNAYSALKVTLPWRDDFYYASKNEMKAAGWSLEHEELINVGSSLLTLDNDGSVQARCFFSGHFPSGAYDFKVETKGKWIGRTYGSLLLFVITARHNYMLHLDGYYPNYAFVRDTMSDEIRFGGYVPQFNTWLTMGFEKRGNTIFLYQNDNVIYTYTEPDTNPDPLLGVGIGAGWISTNQYDYISVSIPSKPLPNKGEPRGVFVRLSQLLEISKDDPTITNPSLVRSRINSFINDLVYNNINTIYVGFKDDGASYDYSLVSDNIGYKDPGYASGNLMYNSLVYPNMVYGPVKDLLPNIDPMSYLLQKAHAATKPIEVHAWVPLFIDYLGWKRLGLPLQPAALGKTIAEYVKPEDITVQLYNLQILSEITANYDVDGVNIDYVRCSEDSSADYRLGKQKIIVDFVSNVRETLPQTILSADVMSWCYQTAYNNIAQDYVGISRHVDVIMPMTYFADANKEPSWVGEQISYFRSLVYCPYVTPIVEGYHSRDSQGNIVRAITTDDVVDAIELAKENKADGFSLFNYISLRDDLGTEALSTICTIVSNDVALVSWKIAASLETDSPTYWALFPTINFHGSFLMRNCGNPLANHPITLEIRNVWHAWLDFEIKGSTGDDGSFYGQLSGIAMLPGEWLFRIQDDTYGAAASTTFQVEWLPSSIVFTVLSPVNILVTDPNGARVGFDPNAGAIIEIENAYYSGPGTEPQLVMIPKQSDGTYDVTLVGMATGGYTLTIEYIMADRKTSQTFTGTITQNQQQYYSATISETEEMTTISWEYMFKDSRRGTMLKISADDKYFQFIAPNKDFGIKHDPNMVSYRSIIAICYKDSEIIMIAIAATGKIVGCTATLLDRQACKLYWLFTIQKALSC